jgi:hypothetical protein
MGRFLVEADASRANAHFAHEFGDVDRRGVAGSELPTNLECAVVCDHLGKDIEDGLSLVSYSIRIGGSGGGGNYVFCPKVEQKQLRFAAPCPAMEGNHVARTLDTVLS